LAQFELRASTRARRLKNWQRGVSTFWRSKPWQPARWGLGLLLAGQLLGLNVWAWTTRADWQAQQKNWAQLLREAFPQTQVVIDAPVQMAREVERLRLASGQLSASDLEPMLSALGRALPSELMAPEQWTYQSGQLRLQGFKPSAAQQQALQQELAAGGYGWRPDGDAWLISLTPASETAPWPQAPQR
jgi:general secretion pathway protein L